MINIPQLPKTFSIFTKSYANNTDWYEKSWSGVLNPLFLVGYGCVYYINKRVPDSYRSAFCYLENNRLHWFWDNRDLERLRKRILNLIKNNPTQINKWYQQWQKDWMILEGVYKKLDKLDLKHDRASEIYSLYEELKQAYVMESTLPYLVDSFLSNKEKDWYIESINNELDKLHIQDKDKTLSALTRPVFNSFTQDELIELLYICTKVYKKGYLYKRITSKTSFSSAVLADPKILKLFTNHAQRYYWIENSYFQSTPLKTKYFIEKARKILKQEDNILKHYRDEKNKSLSNRRIKQRFLTGNKFSPNFKKLIKYTDIFTKWQDTRKAGVFRTNHYIFAILNELARRYKISKDIIYFTYDPEMEKLIHSGAINKKLIKNRIRGCAFYVCPKGWRFFEYNEFKKINRAIFEGQNRGISEIRGVTACPGLVTGKARLVVNISDLVKLKKGEILVTNNTTPDFVPAMKKAGAIVTEQGGITTHAAIVSRELNKPCVIGTKIATKVLKTGDMVEVDANNGIIKIIK